MRRDWTEGSNAFEQKYPVALNSLLLAPIIFREDLPALSKAAHVSANAMTDLDRPRDDAAREAFGAGIVESMERALPGFRQQVVSVDVATPVTVERDTGTPGITTVTP